MLDSKNKKNELGPIHLPHTTPLDHSPPPLSMPASRSLSFAFSLYPTHALPRHTVLVLVICTCWPTTGLLPTGAPSPAAQPALCWLLPLTPQRASLAVPNLRPPTRNSRTLSLCLTPLPGLFLFLAPNLHILFTVMHRMPPPPLLVLPLPPPPGRPSSYPGSASPPSHFPTSPSCPPGH